jgi:hypothetical protein
MRVGELISLLNKLDRKLEVLVFTAGDSYPVLQVDNSINYPEVSKTVCELGCGWATLEDLIEDDSK